MKICAAFFWITLGALAISADAFAAEGSSSSTKQPLIPAAPVMPSVGMPPLPPVETPAPVTKSTFPSLPLSKPCKTEDMEGLWKLQHVYEEPVGTESQGFEAAPVQYVLYQSDGVYGKYNGSRTVMPPKFVIGQIRQHSTGLLQYVVQASGIVYFYQDKVATQAQSCFIAVEARDDQFTKDDMLLMPPKGQIQGRLVKVYTKVWSRSNSNNPPQQNGPRRGKRMRQPDTMNQQAPEEPF
jgi:hypothetical protein